MNYKNKKVAITGHTGFIGRKLSARLGEMGALVYKLDGDTRTGWDLDHTFDYFFHFGSPSSQVLFERRPLYCADVTINGFINAVRVCRENGIKLIYPSTGLLSQNRYNEYAMCKKICENIHLGENLDAMGLRIFASYGEGEETKRDYASVPYLFADMMVRKFRPTVFGDGTQVRDFIYIDDVVEAILHLTEECNEKIVDIGSGEQTSFNSIVELIGKELGLKILPNYIPRPKEYVSETIAVPNTMFQYYQPKIKFQDGIKRTVKWIQSLSQQQ